MANQVVTLSMVGSAGIVVADDLRQGKGIRGTHLLALGFVFIALSATSDVAPKVAVPFSLLIFTGILLTKGAKVFGTLNPGGVKVPKYKGAPSSFVPIRGDTFHPNQVVVPPRQRHRTTGPSGVTS